MADVAQIATTPQTGAYGAPTDVKFSGAQNNMALGVGLLIAGGLSFSMGMTDVYFAGALAWVFVIWGALFIYIDLIDNAETFIVTEDALVLENYMRPFSRNKVWPWADINRMDIVVTRVDGHERDAEMRIYYMEPDGEITIEREDRTYTPALAQLVVEQAGLSPVGDSELIDFEHLPTGKATFIWQ